MKKRSSPKTKRKVFISHSSADTWIAEQIDFRIKKRGAISFLDKRKVQAGSFIAKTIFGFLKETHEFLVLFTPGALVKPYIWFELGGAWSRPDSILIVIVLHGITIHDFVSRDDIPHFLKKLYIIELNNINNYFDELSSRASALTFTSRRANSKRTKKVAKWTYDAYLSYSNEDAVWALELARILHRKGLSIWSNTREIFPGEEMLLEQQNERALRESNLFVLTLSSSSINNPLSYFELGSAYATGKKILIVTQKGVSRDSIPEFLMDFKYLEECSPNEVTKYILRIL